MHKPGMTGTRTADKRLLLQKTQVGGQIVDGYTDLSSGRGTQSTYVGACVIWTIIIALTLGIPIGVVAGSAGEGKPKKNALSPDFSVNMGDNMFNGQDDGDQHGSTGTPPSPPPPTPPLPISDTWLNGKICANPNFGISKMCTSTTDQSEPGACQCKSGYVTYIPSSSDCDSGSFGAECKAGQAFDCYNEGYAGNLGELADGNNFFLIDGNAFNFNGAVSAADSPYLMGKPGTFSRLLCAGVQVTDSGGTPTKTAVLGEEAKGALGIECYFGIKTTLYSTTNKKMCFRGVTNNVTTNDFSGMNPEPNPWTEAQEPAVKNEYIFGGLNMQCRSNSISIVANTIPVNQGAIGEDQLTGLEFLTCWNSFESCMTCNNNYDSASCDDATTPQAGNEATYPFYSCGQISDSDLQITPGTTVQVTTYSS